jgi:hypothetical protein
MIKSTIFWIFIVVGILASIITIFEGIKRNRRNKVRFKINHLFTPKVDSQKSGTELIILAMICISLIIIRFLFWGPM